MSVREYIGARYIPQFADPTEWSDDVGYEPLTVVTYQGGSYVSKQSVPIGIDISNTDYWILWADYNAQIEAYRREVQTFDGRISTLEGDLPTTDFSSASTVKDAIDDVAALIPSTDFTSESTVKDAIDDVAALLPSTSFDTTNTVEKAIFNRGKRNMILIGDSFGVGVTPDVPLVSSKGWIQWCADYLEGYANVFWGQVPLGGVYGFASSRPFLDVLQDIEENYVTVDNNLITDIVVLAGSNDWTYSKATISTAIYNFAAYCHSHFPNALVRIGAIGTNIRKLRADITPKYKECTKYGCGYIDCLTNLFCDTQYIASDNTHLTQAGYEFYAPWVCDCILHGFTSYMFEKKDLDFTVTTNWFNNPAASGYPVAKAAQYVNENGCSCQLRSIGGIYANCAFMGFTTQAASELNTILGYIDNGLVMPVVASEPCQIGELQRQCTVSSSSPSANIKVVSCDRKIYTYLHPDTTPTRTYLGTFIQVPVGGLSPSTYGEVTNAMWPYDRLFIPNAS